VSKVYDWTVAGKPVTKGRPRFMLMRLSNEVIATYLRRGDYKGLWARLHGCIRVHTDTQTEDAERRFRANSLFVAPDEPIGAKVPLSLDITFIMPLPKTRKKWQRAFFPHVERPDLDNMAKLVKDAMQGLFYDDDSAVAEMVVRKVYGETGETRVTLSEIDVDTWARERQKESE
jgi:Holliday junction resolvase RusA-like endonuclease